MTDFSTLFFLAVPFSVANKDLMQRVSVSVFAEGITSGERNQLLTGAKTIQQVIDAHAGDQTTIDSINNNNNGFQTVYSLLPGGLTQDMYVGSASLNNMQAGRMAAFADNMTPVGSLFSEAKLQEDDTWLCSNRHSNNTILNGLENTVISGAAAIIAALGWSRYNPGGYF